MATLVITIKNNNVDAHDIAQAGQPHRNIVNIENIIHGLKTGSIVGSMDVQRSDNDPVRASGTLTLTYASISANDTVVIGGTTLTCVTGTPSGYTQWDPLESTCRHASLSIL